MPWPQGTDATNNIKSVLVSWLTAQLKSSPYKSRMPNRSVAVAAPVGTEKIHGSIKILVYTGKDEQMPHEFTSTSGRCMEEYHRITIDVQSDERGARANEDAQVASIIRQIFQTQAQRETLGGLGIYNVRETADAVQMADVQFKRPINLTCSTDVLL